MRTVLKWVAIVLGALVGLAVVAGVGLAIYGQASFKRTHADRELYPITADTSPEGLARGEYLMEESMKCTEACHTEGARALAGGSEAINEGPFSGVFAVPNLTPDMETGLGGWTDAEIARAIREGLDKDGVSLVVMPSYNYRALSDSDVAAMVGYLRSLDPVQHEVPAFQLNTFGKVMLALGTFGPSPVGEPITARQDTPQPGTVENGRYMVALGACSDCHQADMAGGPLPFSGPDDVPAANLTPAGELVGWTEEMFIAAVRDGQHPTGRALDEGMPRYGTDDQDLRDIFAYLKTLPAVPSD
jgi:mono/diheme cytochrome c family protein